MAATQKTLTPTNEVISIPAFADKPDYRLPIDSTGKLADAINTLDSKINNGHKGGIYNPAGTYNVTLDPNTATYLMGVVRIDNSPDRDGLYMIYINNANAEDSKVVEIKPSSAISSITIGQNGVVTFTTAVNWVNIKFMKM